MKQGKALHHNIGIALWYNRELNKALKGMFDDTLKTIVPTFTETIAEDSVFDITVELDKLRKKYIGVNFSFLSIQHYILSGTLLGIWPCLMGF